MNAAFDQDESELAVLVLAIAFQMFANLDGLFDEHVKVLRYFGSQAVGLKNANDLLPSDALDLRHTMGITENDTDLRWVEALLGKFANLVLDVSGRHLEPAGGAALVGQRAAGDTLSWSVHATHDGKFSSSA